MKRIRILALLCAALLLLTGCFGKGREYTNMTKTWDCGTPVAARYFFADEIEELAPEKLDELVETLDSMTYRRHSFHTDYFWHGKFGLELELDDGTFWFYDGTEMELRSVSIIESTANEYVLEKRFAEVTSCDLWKTLAPFFSSINKTGQLGTW